MLPVHGYFEGAYINGLSVIPITNGLDVIWTSTPGISSSGPMSDITGYELRYRATGTSPWTSIAVHPHTFFFNIPSLTPLQEYQVKVRVNRNGGYSPWARTTGTPTAP